ncbi:MAG: hypothetical protein A3H94_05050 [Acidobacteria bacterium RIFCSPLOWO2_02_FULL_60_20]|nr:MAG: hypothetical protein A3H94_05050 [Acidobacteria bacterium RIFCSPLOWO2_02_FULL_60_20]
MSVGRQKFQPGSHTAACDAVIERAMVPFLTQQGSVKAQGELPAVSNLIRKIHCQLHGLA